jgi:hypothetical protein
VRQERNLQDAVGDAELLGARTKAAFDGRPAMRHRDQPDLDSGLLESLHRSKKRERSFGFAELAIDAEIGEVA